MDPETEQKFCTQCGRNLPDGATFCPECGNRIQQNADKSVYSYTLSYQPSPANGKYSLKKIEKAVIALAVVIVIVYFVFFFGFGDNDDGGSLNGQEFYSSMETVTAFNEEDGYVVDAVSGFGPEDKPYATLFFVENDRTEEYKISKVLRLALNDEIQNKYDQYSWNIIDETTGLPLTPVPLVKSEGFVTLYTITANSFLYEVTCTNTSDSSTESFNFEIKLGFANVYDWKYDGGKFGFGLVMWSGDVVSAVTEEQRLARDLKDYSKCPQFVTDGDPSGKVTEVEEQLRKLYTEAYGHWDKDQDYADFILGYVQAAFLYITDETLYKQNEYFAYPTETLLYMGGDCEDTSILASAIYRAAGYKTALLMLPAHMMAGVAIEDYEEPETDFDEEILKDTVKGTTYYACETTLDTFSPVGISQGSGTKDYSEYLNKGYAGYGSFTFYPVEA